MMKRVTRTPRVKNDPARNPQRWARIAASTHGNDVATRIAFDMHALAAKHGLGSDAAFWKSVIGCLRSL